MKYSSGALALLLVAGFWFVADPRPEEGGLTALETSLGFRIVPDRPGAAAGLFTIAKGELSDITAVVYRPAEGTVEFKISGVRRGGPRDTLDNPLFCFDYSDQPDNYQLRVNVDKLEGLNAVPAVGLTSALQYNTSTSQIMATPPAPVQCFYYSEGPDPKFGLFGVPPSEIASPDNSTNEDVIFGDGFEAEMGMEIAFRDVELSTSGILSYTLEVKNTGDGVLNGVSFQEVYPSADLYPISLSAGLWRCLGLAVEPVNGEGLIRFSNKSIAPGETIGCAVSRIVTGSDGILQLHAGAVAGPGAGALYTVEVEKITVD